MLIGIPKEIKNNENRVALTPAGVHSLVSRGHRVLIETNAGLGSGFTDADYQKQGAEIVATAAEAWAAELVVKVKEPLASEYGYLRDDQLSCPGFTSSSDNFSSLLLIVSISEARTETSICFDKDAMTTAD